MQTTFPAAPAVSPSLVPAERIASAPDRVLTARIRLVGRVVAVALCALHAYANRHLINPDGISYLDVASAYARGDFAAAVNAYWSPLYSWLLAAVFTVFRPTAYWECAVAHGVNVAIFLVALMAFEWLLSELLAGRANQREGLRESWQDLLPDWLVVGVAYALFAVVSRRLVTVSLLTPDMLVAAGAYASAALLLRLGRTRSPRLAALLGVVLGLSYLAKTVMFPLSLVFFAVLLAATGRRGPRELLLAGFAWALVALPWAGVLAWSMGKPTFGESGRLNYLWNINGVATPERFGREGSHFVCGGAPTMVTDCDHRLGKEKQTYALWYDPPDTYRWQAARVDLRGHAAAAGKVAAFYYTLLAEKLLAFTGAVIVLTAFAFFSRRGPAGTWLRRWLRDLAALSPLLVPALAALAMYTLVGHAEGRLVGPFVVLLGLALLAAIRLPHPRQVAVQPVGAAFLTLLGVLLGGNLIFDAGKALAAARAGEGGPAHPHWLVAQELRALGVRPGDGVASVGYTYNAYWARLAGCPCVAEVPQGEARRFWAAAPAERTQALTAMRLAGARAAVADDAPPGAGGWRRVPGTAYAIRPLPRD